MNETISKIKATVNNILTAVFPFEDFNDRPSVFIQQTWLDKIMMSTQIKDYLWTPPANK